VPEPTRRDCEDNFRTEVARLIQSARHHLSAENGPPEVIPLLGQIRHLGVLLDAGAQIEHLQEAALAVIDAYEWPYPEAINSGEGPVINATILAAVERLRTATDAIDQLDDENP
jgi:hypothetical protein